MIYYFFQLWQTLSAHYYSMYSAFNFVIFHYFFIINTIIFSFLFLHFIIVLWLTNKVHSKLHNVPIAK